MRTTFFLFLAFLSFNAFALARIDSVGVIDINGKRFLLHKVEHKETLYALSKKYAVSIDQIKECNSFDDGLKEGIIIRIPQNATKTGLTKPVAPVAVPRDVRSVKGNSFLKSDKGDPVIHVVSAGETIYGLSRILPTSTVGDIKLWNDIKDDDVLSIGDTVLIGYKPKTVVDSKQLKADKPEQSVIINSTPTNDVIKVSDGNELREVKKSVLVEWDETGALSPNKKLAYHKSLPIGTIIQVTNPKNNKVVYVKVVGKLNSNSDNLEMKVSRSVAENLNAGSKRFLADLSFGVR
jgi:LysM repeat protein